MFNLRSKSRSVKWVAILALSLTGAQAAKAAQSLALTWNASTAAGIVGYHIHYGDDGNKFQYVADAGTNTNYVVSGLQEGQTNSFVVTAYDALGIESAPSNLISYIVPGLVDLAPKASPRHPTVIRFVVAPGHTYQVQASENLTTWNTIGQITATNNTWTQFEDIEGANLKLRFYRLVWQ
jgi:fibronectin type 3 domain-containing protein